MRITESMRVRTSTWVTARNAERLERLARQAASGERVSAPSDDPGAFSVRIQGEARALLLGARRDAAGLAAGDLQLAEGALASASDLLVRARELAVQMSNGSVDAASRANAAKEVRDLRAQLIGIANERGARGYLFGGDKVDTPPFTSTGAFLGDDGVQYVETSDGVRTQANTSGARAFTAAGGQDIFATLDAFANALAANDLNNVRASIGALEGAHRQVVDARVATGLTAERLTLASTAISDALDAAREALAGVVEADSNETYSDLVASQAGYQRALEITKRLLSMSALERLG
jgi:flagellar hook-associated protein 3 FlgL